MLCLANVQPPYPTLRFGIIGNLLVSSYFSQLVPVPGRKRHPHGGKRRQRNGLARIGADHAMFPRYFREIIGLSLRPWNTCLLLAPSRPQRMGGWTFSLVFFGLALLLFPFPLSETRYNYGYASQTEPLSTI
ncbi:hypothetical protein N658DRAFT_91486 [Parathielavia hyrcaniae]|uniref:Uncharacterized protein n=1 Tax=Parathielavia hyrcaniae TaxID=113614 RepID=A0AAN6PZ46_9PEZI|nr:hypothetical protein N658DRAFT_91486 [Parathielavia hyrcaniae]